jgi:hypothetical protein
VRIGVECIIRADDERKRPTSKAYTNTLTNRIKVLEQMLKEQGEEPPPIVYPPKTKNGAPSTTLEVSEEPEKPRKRSKSNDSGSVIVSQEKQPGMLSHQPVSDMQHVFDNLFNENLNGSVERNSSESPPYSVPSPPKSGSLMSRLLSTQGHLSFDSISGHQRYYGPTT